MKRKFDTREPTGTVIHEFEKETFIVAENDTKILFASTGDFTVNFNPSSPNTGTALNESELEKIG